ncbi:MAG TPA: TolC family protein [Opitutaceae bacterium]|nr:TolC family protein [Opitutaceae bacterium]
MKHRFKILLAIGLAASTAAGQRTPRAPEVPDTLDLPTAIAYAVENNFSIRQARERIREQEGLILEVRALALPSATLNSFYETFDDALNDDRPSATSTQDWRVSIDVRQTLYSGGGVRAALDSQKSLREAVRRDLEGVVNTALLDVRTRFYDVLLAREQIKVQEQNVTLLREQLQTSKNRFEAGAVSNFDVLRAEVELANALPELIRARNSFRTAIDALRFSLGYVNTSPGTIAKIPEFVGTLDYTPVNFELESTLATARESRPELLRLAALAEAQDANVRFARSGYLPDLALVGGYQFRKSGFSDRFAESIDGWSVGLQSSWAIFDGKRTAGQVAQARSQLAQSELRLDEFGLSVEVEVRRALSAFQEAGELVDAAEKVVGQAQEALRLANSRYGAGTATQLDVLTTQVSLVRAQLNKLQAVYNYNVSVARVRQAAGMPDPLVRFDPAS